MTDLVVGSAAARGELEPQLEQYRVELTGYCYRMLGSAFDAEDAVQETLVRAWKSLERFEGRSSLRSWLYRIATNVCLTAIEGRGRRARPMDFGPAGTAESSLGEAHGEATWLQPVPDARVVSTDGDPAELAVARETIRLAFVAALQHLPARQRAVLILREVLQWSAAETAELLGSTVASVNSALQRARATLAEQQQALGDGAAQPVAEDQQSLLDRYADAFQRYDMDALVAMLHEDVVLSMPPYELWLQGPVEVRKWWVGPGAGCAGSRLLPITANGMPGFGQYRPSPNGGHDAWALQVLDIAEGKFVGFNAFLDVANMFPLFGLPLHLDPEDEVVTAS